MGFRNPPKTTGRSWTKRAHSLLNCSTLTMKDAWLSATLSAASLLSLYLKRDCTQKVTGNIQTSGSLHKDTTRAPPSNPLSSCPLQHDYFDIKHQRVHKSPVQQWGLCAQPSDHAQETAVIGNAQPSGVEPLPARSALVFTLREVAPLYKSFGSKKPPQHPETAWTNIPPRKAKSTRSGLKKYKTWLNRGNSWRERKTQDSDVFLWHTLNQATQRWNGTKI